MNTLRLVVAIIAVFSVNRGFSQTPDSKRISEKDNTPYRNQAGDSKKNQEKATSATLVEKSQSAPLRDDQRGPTSNKEPASNVKDNADTDRDLVKATYWLAGISGAQFVALVIQAIVFWRTLQQIKVQAETMVEHKKSFEDLAVAANENAIIARANVDVLISSQRAWVLAEVSWAFGTPHSPYLTGHKTTLQGGTSLAVHTCLFCTNHGNTPAQIIETRVWAGIFAEIPTEPEMTKVESQVFPGSEPLGPKQVSSKYGSPITTENRLQFSNEHLLIYGVVNYRDSFGEHQTFFGYEVAGPTKEDRLVRIPGEEYNKRT